MSSFPLLRTSAIAQYPLSCRTSFSTEILWFVDGSEQRYRSYVFPIRRWVVQLEGLDEGELSSVRQFFREQMGPTVRFSFIDPVTKTIYENCSFDETTCSGELKDIERGGATLVIRTNE